MHSHTTSQTHHTAHCSCTGSQICSHNRRRSHCKDCGGSEICEHEVKFALCSQLLSVSCLFCSVRVMIQTTTCDLKSTLSRKFVGDAVNAVAPKFASSKFPPCPKSPCVVHDPSIHFHTKCSVERLSCFCTCFASSYPFI